MKLLWNMVWKDIRRNKVISMVLIVFVMLSSILMSGGLHVMGIVQSSTKSLNETAVPPEFLQMHKGEYDREKVQEFTDSHDYIRRSTVISMLDIPNSEIIYNGETLEKCLMDNGFVVQSEGFDYLLDMDNQIAEIHSGEVGVPVYYHEELGINPGDRITLKKNGYQKEFKVAALIRDAQMNAPLASSKRFVVSKEDQEELAKYMGEWEYSFEYLLKPGTKMTTLENDYAKEGMPANGVAITGALLNMLNSVSYGLIAWMLLFVSILLILIAILVLSYMIKATLLEENQNIGNMKAIGFPDRKIEKLYWFKYLVFVLAGCMAGFLLSIPFGELCARQVVLYCGYSEKSLNQWLYPIAGLIFLAVFVLSKCRRTVRKNLRGTVLELMRGEERKKREGHFRLPKNGMRFRNLTMALGELKCKWKEYIVLLLVFVLAAFLILLPMNMQHTLSDPSFITSMGIGECDIRIDLPYSKTMKEDVQKLESYIREASAISEYVIFQNGFIEAQREDGDFERIRVSSGNENIFPLTYETGTTPDKVQEIALSTMEAKSLNKRTGDRLTIKVNGKTQEYRLSGTYQDLTYGGKTGKASVVFSEKTLEGYIVYLNVKDKALIEQKTQELRGVITQGRVVPVVEFKNQTMGGVTEHMTTFMTASSILAIALIVLITAMFLQLIAAREHQAIAIKKAMGFSTDEVRLQLGIRVILLQVLAILIGTFLVNICGEGLFGMLTSSGGAAGIHLTCNPVVSYLGIPLIQLLFCILSILAGTKTIQNYHIRDQITE